MRIIPAIDIINGKCVRLTQGDFATQKIYNEDPVEVAKQFEAHGIKFVHLVDLDGARSNHIVNHKVLSAIADSTSLCIDFGGGIKTNEDIRTAFESGAQQVTAGTVAINDRALFLQWLDTYGPDKIILGADCVKRKICSMGWNKNSETDVVDFINTYAAYGVTTVICTDISKDGMLQGSSDELYIEILKATNIKLVASGGVASLQHIRSLKRIGCEGVIIGKALYEKKIPLKQLSMLC